MASVPARSAAAGTLTRWARAAGWSGTVSGVAGGFQVATASGRRTLAVDLAAVVEQLAAYGVGTERLLDGLAAGVVEGPVTWPGLRPRGEAPDPLAATLNSHGNDRLVLPPDPRRRYRVPGLLMWLAVAEHTGTLGWLTVRLGLGGAAGIEITTGTEGVLGCEAVPSPGEEVLLGADHHTTAGLVALLCPAFLASVGPRGG